MLQENLTTWHANNKGADQAAHSCSLILAVVIAQYKVYNIQIGFIKKCRKAQTTMRIRAI